MPQGERRLGRLDAALKVRVSCDDDASFSAHFSHNLSHDGLFVRATEPRPAGTCLQLEYVLADGRVALRGVGIVRWVRTAAEAGGSSPPGMGVELVEVDGEGRRFLAGLLMRSGTAAPAWVTAVAGAAAFQPELPGDLGVPLPEVPSPDTPPPSLATRADAGGGGTAARVGVASLSAPTLHARRSSAVEPPGRGRGPVVEKSGSATAALTDSRSLEQKRALLIDLSGPELLSGLALEAEGGLRAGAPTTVSPRLSLDADGVHLRPGGLWVPCLVQLSGCRWPSPLAALWARRFGLALSPDGQGGVGLVIAQRVVSLAEALGCCLRELVEPYRNSGALPRSTWVILPAASAPLAVELVRASLAALGFGESHVVPDAVAVLAGAGGLDAPAPTLVVQMDLLDTRLALVRGPGSLLASRTALDTGLWRADEVLASELALRLAARGEAGGAGEATLKGELLAAVAASRSETAEGAPWELAAVGVTLRLASEELVELTQAASDRVLLACEELLAGASVSASALAGVLLAADEPPWPGIVVALERGLGRPVTVVGARVWSRIHGAAALLARQPG